jgi:hypothetical protein
LGERVGQEEKVALAEAEQQERLQRQAAPCRPAMQDVKVVLCIGRPLLSVELDWIIEFLDLAGVKPAGVVLQHHHLDGIEMMLCAPWDAAVHRKEWILPPRKLSILEDTPVEARDFIQGEVARLYHDLAKLLHVTVMTSAEFMKRIVAGGDVFHG